MELLPTKEMGPSKTFRWTYSLQGVIDKFVVEGKRRLVIQLSFSMHMHFNSLSDYAEVNNFCGSSVSGNWK